MPTADDARALLRDALGPDDDFRPGQLEAIEALVDERARVLVVQRTGWGKSVVYFIASKLLRERGGGPTLLISPLLSLMRDQLRMAREGLGVVAETINSENPDDWDRVEAALAADAVDVLLVSPERLSNERFRNLIRNGMPRGIGMFVVDEAHCISDWGHDFRPEYGRIRNIIALLPANVPLLATTATANDRVVHDVEEQLGPNLRVIRGTLARDSLRLQAIELADQAERLAWLATNLAELPGSGIIYCLTKEDCERVAGWLSARGFPVAAYHSDSPDRPALEDLLRHNNVKALVATLALGMGFDKPDLGFIIHFQRPGSVVAYYQQIGRAGRAVARADVVLLAGSEDDAIEDFFINGAFPPEDELRAVLDAIEGHENGLRLTDLTTGINLSESRIKRALRVLELDGAVFKESGRYVRSASPWARDSQRIADVTARRLEERDRMREFVSLESCLMEFLQEQLDDPTAAACGRCAICAGDFVSADVPEATVLDAVSYLRRIDRPIEPRRRWPNGRVAGRSGMIPTLVQAQPGRALSIYGDAGWGRLVRDAKYRGQGFGDELVDAAAELIEIRWAPTPAPTWVVPMPSTRSDRVPDFAQRLAGRLGLEYREALIKVADRPEQKSRQNSQQQLANVIGAFEVIPELVSDEPALLVDDMVDSRWSITECTRLLRTAGSGPIYPFALADSSNTDG